MNAKLESIKKLESNLKPLVPVWLWLYLFFIPLLLRLFFIHFDLFPNNTWIRLIFIIPFSVPTYFFMRKRSQQNRQAIANFLGKAFQLVEAKEFYEKIENQIDHVVILKVRFFGWLFAWQPIIFGFNRNTGRPISLESASIFTFAKITKLCKKHQITILDSNGNFVYIPIANTDPWSMNRGKSTQKHSFH